MKDILLLWGSTAQNLEQEGGFLKDNRKEYRKILGMPSDYIYMKLLPKIGRYNLAYDLVNRPGPLWLAGCDY